MKVESNVKNRHVPVGFIPYPHDFHLFNIEDQHYVFDRNSLHYFRMTDLLKELLTYPNSLTPDEVINDLSKRFDQDQAAEAVKEFQELQKRNLFVSYQEIPSAPYSNRKYKLSLGITQRCNLSCQYCYAAADQKMSRSSDRIELEDMSEETAYRAIDFLINQFGKDAQEYEVNIVGGGEPLLHFELISKIREYCREVEEKIGKKIHFWSFTNGTVFNDEIVKYYGEKKEGLTISLDGPAQIHDELRPFPDGSGTYLTIKEGLERIKKGAGNSTGIGHIWISSVISGQHMNLKEIVEEIVDLQVPNAMIRPIRTDREGLKISKANVDSLKSAYSELTEFLMEKTLEGDLRYIKLILTQRDYLGRFILRLTFHRQTAYRCDAGKSQICILPDGDIYPCDIACGMDELKMGNLFNNEVIDFEKQKNYFNQFVTLKQSCKKCWAYLVCGGGCAYSAYLKNGDISQPDPVLCQLVRHVIECGLKFLLTIQEKAPHTAKELRHFSAMKAKIVDRTHY